MTTKDTEVAKAKAPKIESFDIGNYVNKDETTGEFLHLLSPVDGTPLHGKDGEEIGVFLLGRDSDTYRNAQRAITNRRLNSKSNAAITAERIEAEAIELLAKCTVDWQGIVYNGEVLACNLGNVKLIYKAAPWIKEQVDEYIAERSNFLGK